MTYWIVFSKIIKLILSLSMSVPSLQDLLVHLVKSRKLIIMMNMKILYLYLNN